MGNLGLYAVAWCSSSSVYCDSFLVTLCPCNKAEGEHARGDVLKSSVLSSFIVSSAFSESRGECGHAKLCHDVRKRSCSSCASVCSNVRMLA